uniref:Uncharacterized protein n=1 Tax=Rhizophora mucronata TaxID=61149 RepID=A0A2P2P105_RHIMU
MRFLTREKRTMENEKKESESGKKRGREDNTRKKKKFYFSWTRKRKTKPFVNIFQFILDSPKCHDSLAPCCRVQSPILHPSLV